LSSEAFKIAAWNTEPITPDLQPGYKEEVGSWDPTRFERVIDDERRIVEPAFRYDRWAHVYNTRLKRIYSRMSLFEKEGKRKAHKGPIERIAVAFGVKGKKAILAYVGPTFDHEDENGCDFYEDLGDLLEARDVEDYEGIWVWEGWPKGDYSHGEWGTEFDGYSFGNGTWREPIDKEVEALRFGCNPWTEKCPDCAPCPHCNGTGSNCASTPIEGCKHCEGDGRTKPPPLPPKEPDPIEQSMNELRFGSDFKPFKEPPTCPRCENRGVVRCDEERSAA
jgi:hypothetical protein